MSHQPIDFESQGVGRAYSSSIYINKNLSFGSINNILQGKLRFGHSFLSLSNRESCPNYSFFGLNC